VKMSKQDKNDDWYLQYNYDRWQRLKRHPDYRRFCRKYRNCFDWIDGIGYVGLNFAHNEEAVAALDEIKEQFGLSNVYHYDFDENAVHPLSLPTIFKNDLFVNPIGYMVKAKNTTSKQSTIRDNHRIDSSTINHFDPDGDNLFVNPISSTSATLKPSIVRDGHYIDCRINIAPEIPIEQIQESIKRWVKYARSEISTENSRSRFQENLIAYKVYDLRLDREPYDSIRKKLNITEEIARQKFRRAWKLILNEEFNTEKLKQLIGRFFVQSNVPESRSRTVCFQPCCSERVLKFMPSGECRVMPSNSVASFWVLSNPIASIA
jgi:hypothetical protein